MASSSSRKRVRYTFDVHFTSQGEKDAFLRRLKNVRELLTPAGSPSLDNCSLFSALCDSFEGASQTAAPAVTDSSTEPSTKSFLRKW